MKSILALTLFCAAAALSRQSDPRNNSAGPGQGFPVNISSTLSRVSPMHEELFLQKSPGEKKSTALAVMYSLLLPGMGELYAGDFGTGKYFTMVDGALIVALISFDRYANWLKDDSRQYAATHARSAVDGKDDQYFSDIGDFETVYDFNEAVLRDRQPQKLYNPNSDFYWSWDSPANREQYRAIRVNSDDRFNDTRFIVAAIGVNHLVSAINAARLAVRHNKSVEEGQLIDIHADVIGGIAHPAGIRITFSRNF